QIVADFDHDQFGQFRALPDRLHYAVDNGSDLRIAGKIAGGFPDQARPIGQRPPLRVVPDADALEATEVACLDPHAPPFRVGREALEQPYAGSEASTVVKDRHAIAVRIFIVEIGVIDQARPVERPALKRTRIAFLHVRLRGVDLRPQECEHDFTLRCRAGLDHARSLALAVVGRIVPSLISLIVTMQFFVAPPAKHGEVLQTFLSEPFIRLVVNVQRCLARDIFRRGAALLTLVWPTLLRLCVELSLPYLLPMRRPLIFIIVFEAAGEELLASPTSLLPARSSHSSPVHYQATKPVIRSPR